jgi:type I restriction enzyme M protein
MATKKSELYSKLWASCDELRGGMDASQYKDYVLVLLFIKYISDKYANVPYAPIQVPQGAGFKDMVALKGKPDIGDQINKKIIAPLANANKLSEMPDFNDANILARDTDLRRRIRKSEPAHAEPAATSGVAGMRAASAASDPCSLNGSRARRPWIAQI